MRAAAPQYTGMNETMGNIHGPMTDFPSCSPAGWQLPRMKVRLLSIVVALLPSTPNKAIFVSDKQRSEHTAVSPRQNYLAMGRQVSGFRNFGDFDRSAAFDERSLTYTADCVDTCRTFPNVVRWGHSRPAKRVCDECDRAKRGETLGEMAIAFATRHPSNPTRSNHPATKTLDVYKMRMRFDIRAHFELVFLMISFLNFDMQTIKKKLSRVRRCHPLCSRDTEFHAKRNNIPSSARVECLWYIA